MKIYQYEDSTMETDQKLIDDLVQDVINAYITEHQQQTTDSSPDELKGTITTIVNIFIAKATEKYGLEYKMTDEDIHSIMHEILNMSDEEMVKFNTPIDKSYKN